MIRKVISQGGERGKKTEVEDRLLFSFRYFTNDSELCPKTYAPNYTQKFCERLKELSSWTLRQFVSDFRQEIKNHRITWTDTIRYEGFANVLPPQIRDCEPWQFSVTRNEHGRVHGFLLGNIFHIVWLDCHHRLYP